MTDAELLRLASDLPTGTMPAGILDRARASRAAGVRVVIPHVSERATRWGRVAAAVAASVVLGALLVLPSRTTAVDAAAPESILEIEPVAPRAAQALTLRYRPIAGVFGDADSLRVRARTRTAQDVGYRTGTADHAVATLRRQVDGTYTGQLHFPAGVVYMAVAIEDFGAHHVDDRDGRPWQILAHGADGQPSVEALRQRANDFLGQDWEESFAASQQMVARAPGSPAAWGNLSFYIQQMAGEDSARRIYEAHVRPLDDSLRALSTVPQAEIEALRWQAAWHDDTAASRYWMRRLSAVDPLNSVTLSDRLDSLRQAGTAPGDRLRQLERLWGAASGRSEGGDRMLRQTGRLIARQAGDVRAIVRWSDREIEASPETTPIEAAYLSSLATTRRIGIERLRHLLRSSAPGEWRVRRIDEDSATHARRQRTIDQQMLAALGTALHATGADREAMDTLVIASHLGWSPQVDRQLSALARRHGNAELANSAGARVAADPRTTPAESDSLRAAAMTAWTASQWSAAIASAADDMRHLVVSAAGLRLLRGRPTAADSAGRETSVMPVERHGPSVVVFMSTWCPPARQAARAIASVADQLRERHVPITIVFGEARSSATDSLLAASGLGQSRVVYDARKSAQRAFANFSTPNYFVMDSQDRIRFRRLGASIDDMLLQVEALREPSATLAPTTS